MHLIVVRLWREYTKRGKWTTATATVLRFVEVVDMETTAYKVEYIKSALPAIITPDEYRGARVKCIM